ncbi:histidine kinase [Natronosporangium hydrolyticum]|uniref:Histidine kinase n=1 Tax=Natronosporangium hydrolyticum TaxID=2811111 RepID=A0A895YRC3_9ACTN|nr:histidine kinase [Natronosporangium hydrolyticum]QSB16568.1 histidine kinase [Natronosporangium hydrolyticum]
MPSGSRVLAGVLILAWAVVYLVTQVLVTPSLGVGTTLLAGVLLTTVLTLGYPSALRGPRAARTLSRQPGADGSGSGSGRTIAAAGRSMPLRSGLTPDAARRTAQLLRPLLGGDAVAITDRERVLAFVGPGADHHHDADEPRSGPGARAIARARTVVVRGRGSLGCPEPQCPLHSAVVAPLAIGARVVGTLQVYRVHEDPPPRDLVGGLAGILSLHLELAEADRERNLAADAKLDALRAQINPHFLFNVLNTIASKARTDPEQARQLLLRLSDFFRYAVRQDGHFAEFAQEYFFVRTYLSLEQARYGDRLRVRYDIDPQVLTAHVPVLTIQPLVENAVKHGLADKVAGGTVRLKARVDPLTRTTSIEVADDGVGIPADILARITSGEFGESRAGPRPPGGLEAGVDGAAGAAAEGGVGLRNISQRLETLFKERYALQVNSTVGKGTVVELRIPLR